MAAPIGFLSRQFHRVTRQNRRHNLKHQPRSPGRDELVRRVLRGTSIWWSVCKAEEHGEGAVELHQVGGR